MTGKYEIPGNCTIGTLISEQAKKRPDRLALVMRDKDGITYGEMDGISMQVAKSLLALEIPERSIIAIWALNSPEWIYAMGGSARTGHPFSGLNTKYQTAELRQVLSHSGAAVLFIGEGSGGIEGFSDILYQVCPDGKESPPGVFRSGNLPSLRHVISFSHIPHPGMFTWGEFLSLGEGISDDLVLKKQEEIDPDDMAMIMYTSGTTGIPKGVIHTHLDLILVEYLIAKRFDMAESDVSCLPVPFFHILGITMPFSSFITGGTVALLERFSAREMLLTVETYRATSVHGIVTMFSAVLDELKRNSYDISTLRCGLIAGSRCPPDLVGQIIDSMGMPGFMIAYGSTEGICITMSLLDDSRKHKTETLGLPLSGVKMKIVDPSTGASLLPGEVGEALVKCPWMMKGYYHMPEATERVLDPDGFYHTHDLMCVDEDGYYRFIGRIDELIIRSGENLYAVEVEGPLLRHPAVLDAKVVGIPCEYYGEDVVAFVILRPGMKETSHGLKKYLRSTISLHKVPSAILFSDRFPQTASGKVHLALLREMAIVARNEHIVD
jgi:fatty-acyl-CoA synthase